MEYESDDYAYVQDRRAANMSSIIGFGVKPNPDLNEMSGTAIYDYASNYGLSVFANAIVQPEYIYVHLNEPIVATGVAGKKEFAARYLADVKQLFLKKLRE